jgi:sigma-B regulation protein RsbU (phosphoserine phosphatase)
VQIVQAGHPHPLVLRTDGSAEFIGDGGMPIGLLKDAQYSRFEVAMEPGDKLLFYSDGFTECRLENGEMLESDGMLALFGESLPALTGLNLLDDVFSKLTGVISSEHGLEDDVSGALFEFARS